MGVGSDIVADDDTLSDVLRPVMNEKVPNLYRLMEAVERYINDL